MMAVKKCLITLLAVVVSFSVHALPKSGRVKETVLAFRDAVNAHDVARITALLANDHVCIDATGMEIKGKEKAKLRWAFYYQYDSAYHVEFSEVFVNGDTVAAFGFVEGKHNGVKDSHWRSPASWMVVVRDQQVVLWKEYGHRQSHLEGAFKNDSAYRASLLPRVTGVGGLFFKSKEPKVLKAWYKEHLHLDAGPYGATFDWRQGDDATKYGCTQWTVFGEKTTYFAPSVKDFMINYRVAYLEQLVEQLRKDGVTIVDTLDVSDYGKFIHILDCEQNKVELWEPKEEEYDKKIRER